MSRTLVWGLLRVVAIVALPGCGLVLDTDPRGSGENLECSVTVRNPDGMEVLVSSVTHPDFLNQRRYFTCEGGRCPPTCSRSTVAEAEADWRIWARREIERISVDPASTSTFRAVAGPWCEVPDTLSCVATGQSLIDTPPCDDITGPDLCTATPIAGDPCVVVSCPDPGCTAIDFGDIPISDMPSGGGVRQQVTVDNCGVVDVRARIDQTILPVGARSQFTVPTDTFDCGPRNLDEMMLGRVLESAPGDSECTFDIEFNPTMPLDHQAQKIFWSEALPDHTIALSGFGLGGGLIDDAPTNMCFTEMTPCTAVQTITLSNAGPGPIIINRVWSSVANFEVLPLSPTPSFALNPGDPPFAIQVQWCAGPPGALTGVLRIETSERRIVIDLRTLPSCP